MAAAADVTLRMTLRHRAVTMLVSVLLLIGTGYLFTIVPTGFLPSEDQGRFMVNTEAAQGISYDDMSRHQMQVASLLAKDPNVYMANVMVGAIGNNGGALNTGRIWVELKPRADRNISVDQLIAQLRPKVSQIPGIRAFMTNQPPINLGSGQGGQRGLYQFTLQDTDTGELYKYAPIMEEKIRGISGLEDVSSDLLLRTLGHRRHGPQQGVGARPHGEPGGKFTVRRLWRGESRIYAPTIVQVISDRAGIWDPPRCHCSRPIEHPARRRIGGEAPDRRRSPVRRPPGALP